MKIISTNIAKVTTLIHQGKPIKTAILKQPTGNQVTIERTGILGDEQADRKWHGGEEKAVFGFSANHYLYWQQQLNHDTLSAGMFGENFTVSDFSEEHINIGDRFRFGSALLEVSQPRDPCFKLALAIGDERILKLFTRSYCTGIYFRVIETGHAKTGDKVQCEHKANHDISVKKLFRAVYDNQYSEALHVMKTALKLPELAPEWQEKLHTRLSKKN
jgi:MOSC domain-containing protein YiiM